MCFIYFFSIKTLNLYEVGTIIILFHRKKIGTREGKYHLPPMTVMNLWLKQVETAILNTALMHPILFPLLSCPLMAASQETSKENSVGFQTMICKEEEALYSPSCWTAFQEVHVIAKIFRRLGQIMVWQSISYYQKNL